MYAELPRLRMERNSDLALLQESVLQAASILGYPVAPRLVKDVDDVMVWEV
jgi:hypothetical protein